MQIPFSNAVVASVYLNPDGDGLFPDEPKGSTRSRELYNQRNTLVAALKDKGLFDSTDNGLADQILAQISGETREPKQDIKSFLEDNFKGLRRFGHEFRKAMENNIIDHGLTAAVEPCRLAVISMVLADAYIPDNQTLEHEFE